MYLNVILGLLVVAPAAARTISRGGGSLDPATAGAIYGTLLGVFVGVPLLSWLIIGVIMRRKCWVRKIRRSKTSRQYMYKYCVSRRGLLKTPARKGDPCWAEDKDAVCGLGMGINVNHEWETYGVDVNDEPCNAPWAVPNPLQAASTGSTSTAGTLSAAHESGMSKTTATGPVPTYAYGAAPNATYPAAIPGEQPPIGWNASTSMPGTLPQAQAQPYYNPMIVGGVAPVAGGMPQPMAGAYVYGSQPMPGMAPAPHTGVPMQAAAASANASGDPVNYPAPGPMQPATSTSASTYGQPPMPALPVQSVGYGSYGGGYGGGYSSGYASTPATGMPMPMSQPPATNNMAL